MHTRYFECPYLRALSSGGNYWSDYQNRYPNASELSSSGIWDTPYIIDGNNQDNYPLIPEFPLFLLLPIFTIPTLLLVYTSKRTYVPHP